MLNDLAKRIDDINTAHGFEVRLDNLSEKLMLCVDELSEAHEELRDGKDPSKVYYAAAIGYWCKAHHDPKCQKCQGSGEVDRDVWLEAHWERYEQSKPEGFAIEIIDAIVRELHILHRLGVDIEALMEEKLTYNDSRPYKHGRQF